MKIVVFGIERRVGLVVGDQVIDVHRACAKYLKERQSEPRPFAMAAALAPADLGAFVEAGPRALETAQKAADYLLKEAGDRAGLAGGQLLFELSAVKLHAPKPGLATRIACTGGNYAAHTASMSTNRGNPISVEDMFQRSRKDGPWGFWKVSHDVAATEEDVIYPSRTQRFDYEGEVGVILGKRGKDFTEAQARDAIWGVTLVNDWSIRDGGGTPRGMSFNINKNFDTCTSMGPCIVVGELDPQDVAVKTVVDGQTRQEYNTREMIYSFAEFLSYLSRDFTFVPGDSLSGGTGAGTAMDSSKYVDGKAEPELFLKPGNVVEVSSPAIGALRNRIVAKPAA